MTWLVLLLEWLERKCARARRLTFEEHRFADHLLDTTPKARRGKWL